MPPPLPSIIDAAERAPDAGLAAVPMTISDDQESPYLAVGEHCGITSCVQHIGAGCCDLFGGVLV